MKMFLKLCLPLVRNGISILMSEFDLPVNAIKFLQGKLDIDSAAGFGS